jgi:glycosyltransferase involved in cell wall biosynthesis
MIRVRILISSYNGGRFLPQQLTSLLRQTYQPEIILIRDDGSTDDTLNILQEFTKRYANIQLHIGQHIGLFPSFMKLLDIASDDVDYVAFCDQDDVWLETRLERALNILSEYASDKPLGYCCRLKVVDEALNPIGVSRLPRRSPDFANALVENIATGCTQVFNQTARQLIVKNQPDWSQIPTHDWWAYQVITAFGEMIYDPEPQVLYRQHCGNAIGMKANRLQARLRRFAVNRRPCTRQAAIFQKVFGNQLPDKKRHILERFLDSRKFLARRLDYALNGEVYRQSWYDNLIFRALYALNRI